jgi:hypothetical protein
MLRLAQIDEFARCGFGADYFDELPFFAGPPARKVRNQGEN